MRKPLVSSRARRAAPEARRDASGKILVTGVPGPTVTTLRSAEWSATAACLRTSKAALLLATRRSDHRMVAPAIRYGSAIT